MSAILGLLLGVGLVLCVSPLLWPLPLPLPPPMPRIAGRLHDRLEVTLTQAGLEQAKPSVVVVVSALTSAAAAAVVAALTPVVVLALLAAIGGAGVPWVLVSVRARARLRAARVVWPDVVDHLVSALRAGLALVDALSALAESGPPPTRAAFREFAREVTTSGDVTGALDTLKIRLADPAADRIVEVLRMTREVGGTEIVGVLRTLSSHLRQDAALRSEVESRQSWIRNAARLGVAAPWVVLVMLASRPEAAEAYGSPSGAVLLGAGLVVTVVAYRLMVALGRLPDERRWFA